MSKEDYNVYNTFDINFVNYGELYKTPRDMEANSSELIGDYADALVKGPSDVYVNSPELLGNRYFMDTQTQCLDKNDNTQVHNRSVLVDNVHASAMAKAKDGNKGIIYSLLASMKSIDNDTMFPMDNGEPTSFQKHSGTGYLSNVEQKPMPLCTSVSVYTDDKKDRDITGWVIEEDRGNIDPLAIREGMTSRTIEGMGPPMTIGGDMTGDQFMDGAKKQKAVMDEHVKATADSVNTEAQKAKDSAQNAVKKSQESANNHSKNSQSQTSDMTSKNIAEQKKRFKSAKNAGSKIALKQETKKYLSDNSKTSIYDLFKTLLNTTYQCGKNEENYRRVPYLCVEAIWNAHQIPDQNGVDGRRNDLCGGPRKPLPATKTKPISSDKLSPSPSPSDQLISPQAEQERLEREKMEKEIEIEIAKHSGQIDQLRKPISPQTFFNEFIQLMRDNQNNTRTLNKLPSIPPKQICIMAPGKIVGIFAFFSKPPDVPTMIDGQDYKTMEGLLNNTYRYKVAETIVRYGNLFGYGQCKAVEDLENDGGSTEDCCSCEGFSDTFLQCPKQGVDVSWLDMGAMFYIFILFLVLFFIIYKMIAKSFSLDKIIKKVRFS